MLLLLLQIILPTRLWALAVPGAPSACYARTGHLNLGMLVSLHQPGTGDSPCGPFVSASKIQDVAALIYATDTINAREDLLPNVTLGLVVLDECSSVMTALASSVHLLPNSDLHQQQGLGFKTNCSNGPPNIRIIGAIGPTYSSMAVHVGSLLSVFNLPLMGLVTTSDELSDKSRFEYFLRLAPPDHLQARVIVDVLTNFNWSYVSLIYEAGGYGENGARWLRLGARERGICFATVLKMPVDPTDQQVERAIDALLTTRAARVVVLFLVHTQLHKLMPMIEQRGLSGWFLWVGADGMSYFTYGKGADGALVVHLRNDYYEPFLNGFHDRPVSAMQDLPWLPDVLLEVYNCTNCNTNMPLPTLVPSPFASKVIDAVYVYATAIDALIRKNCLFAFEDTSLLNQCVNGKTLLPVLKNTTYEGISGRIEFDANGDPLGQYYVKQYVSDRQPENEVVGLWEQQKTMELEEIDWTVFQMLQNNNSHVHSVCSLPCGPREYALPRDVPCCWDCRLCPPQERLNLNKTGCVPCPAFFWPDYDNGTTCVPISPSHLQPGHGVSIALIVASALGILTTLITGGLFISKAKTKLLKASSTGLSILMLVAILLAYLTVIAFILRPSDPVCQVSRTGFHGSVSLLYAPLFAKTSRIYRIFASGKKGITQLRFISNKSLGVIVACLLVVQGIIMAVTEVLSPTRASLSMPATTERYVELHCKIDMASLVAPMAFNFLLLAACSLLAFLTRRLPENFNESWYIFVSVSTTLFLWCALLPAALAAPRAAHQAALLATCLILNATVTLLCLYAPKIYAVYFLDESGLQVITLATSIAKIAPASATGQDGPSSDLRR